MITTWTPPRSCAPRYAAAPDGRSGTASRSTAAAALTGRAGPGRSRHQCAGTWASRAQAQEHADGRTAEEVVAARYEVHGVATALDPNTVNPTTVK
jgi:hypothetical protein